MVTEFCGFNKGVVGKDLPSDTTLNNMKKADLIKLLHTAQHNYETLNWFCNNAVNANMAQLNNNGWILCSERLPKDFEYIYATCVSLIDNREPWVIEDVYHSLTGWGSMSPMLSYGEAKVVAWMPHKLPAPYQQKEGVK